MSVLLELSPEAEAFLQAEARRQNKDVSTVTSVLVEEIVRQAAASFAPVNDIAEAQTRLHWHSQRERWLAGLMEQGELTTAKWFANFHDWANSPLHRNLPQLPEEAFDRESFYEDHD